MQSREITTPMVSRTEVFRLIALAEATQIPLLLQGVPGVGKTRCFLDYAAAYAKSQASQNVTEPSTEGDNITDDIPVPGDPETSNEKTVLEETLATISRDDMFILEVDEGTRSSAVKGNVNIEKLVTENQYEMFTPISKAKLILINEVDKANGGMRNSLLSIMNEKMIFNGKEKLPCPWGMFVATCNEIPEDEKLNPFWDRFAIKYEVGRITATQLLRFFEEGGASREQKIILQIPNRSELEAMTIPSEKLSKFIAIAYDHCSDRTLTLVPTLAKAITFIWNCSIDKALIKVAELLMGKSMSMKLSQQLLTNEMKDIMKMVQRIQLADSKATKDAEIANVKNAVSTYIKAGSLTVDQVREIESMIRALVNQEAPADIDDVDAMGSSEAN